MEGSREKSSGPPPPRADEIPAAIDDVLNRIRVIFDFWKKDFTHFCLVQMTRKVSGVLMVNQEGLPIKTTMDSSTTAIYGGMVIALFFQYFLDFSQWLPWSYICLLSAFDNNLHLQVSRLANTAKSVVRDLDNGLFRISQVFGNFFFYISRPK